MLFTVVLALILFFLWIYYRLAYKPLFYDARQYFVRDFADNVAAIRNEAQNVSSQPTIDIARSRTTWSGAKNILNYIDRVNSAGPGWVKSWSLDNKPNNNWLNFPLMVDGKLFDRNATLCPVTTQLLLQHKDKINVAGFSLLQPQSKIETHTDTTGIAFGSLAYHLGLVVPPQCTLIVNGAVIDQRYGRSIVFDSTYPHSAENNSDQKRTILYIDFKMNV